MKKKLWTVDFLINALVNFFLYLVYYSLMVIIVIYAIDRLHAKPSEAGLVSGLFIIGALLARILSGRVVSQLGEKKTLRTGLLIYFAATFLYFPDFGLNGLYFVRFLHGIGFGMSATGAGTIAAQLIPSERRGEGIGYYALTTTLASAIGPFAGIYLSQSENIDIILFISAVLLVTSFIATAHIHLPKRILQAPTAAAGESAYVKTHKFALSDYFEAKAIPISVTSALVVTGYSGLLAFLTPFAKATDLMSAGKVFFLVYSLFVLISRLITGHLFDIKGENFIVYPAIVIFAVGLLLLSVAHGGTLMLCAAALCGFGYGTFFSCCNAIAIKVSNQNRIHLATSTYFAFADLSGGVGPFLLGFLIPVIGFRGLYLVLAGFVLCCTVFYHIAHGAKAAKAMTPSKFVR